MMNELVKTCPVVDGCLNIYQGDIAETGVNIGFQTCNDSLDQVRRVIWAAKSKGMKILDWWDKKHLHVDSYRYGIVIYSQKHPPVRGDAATVRTWADAGIGVLGLAWHRSDQNQEETERLGGSDDQFWGLTRLGRDVIRQCEDHGIIVDVSHCNRRTLLQTCRMANKPVLCTHANPWKVCRVQRNKKNQELKAIARTGGVIGITPIRNMLVKGDGDTDLIGSFLEHLAYVIDLVGIDHVGLATDSYAGGWGVDHHRYPGFTLGHENRWSKLVGILQAKRWPESHIKKILGENFIRVMQVR